MGQQKRRLENRAYAAIATHDTLREKRRRAKKESTRRRLLRRDPSGTPGAFWLQLDWQGSHCLMG